MKYFLMVLVALSLGASARAATFQTSCTATLIGLSDSGTVTLDGASQEFSNDLGDYAKSSSTFLVGDHMLSAFVDLSSGFSGRPPEPTFNVQFFKGNNVQGLVYFSSLRGLSLETRPVGVPLRLSSTKFVTIKRQGVTYSRIDFECNLLRVR